jgi:hypothetical protein
MLVCRYARSLGKFEAGEIGRFISLAGKLGIWILGSVASFMVARCERYGTALHTTFDRTVARTNHA